MFACVVFPLPSKPSMTMKTPFLPMISHPGWLALDIIGRLHKYNLQLRGLLVPKAYWGEIKDPVHGYVYITESEKNIIDSYPMQRLSRLRQLAGSEYVYPGANHTRFEHSVGVMYLAGQVLENPNVSRCRKRRRSGYVQDFSAAS